MLKGCIKLVLLPQIPASLSIINALNCESLEKLDCSFHNPNICLNFSRCFKLNQEARDLIIKASTSEYAVLPGGEVPTYFIHRATTGGSLTVMLNEKPLPTSMRLKVCVLLVNKEVDKNWMDGTDDLIVRCRNNEHYLYPLLTEHLYIFEVEADVTSRKLVFEFKINPNN